MDKKGTKTELLVCPKCKNKLLINDDSLECKICNLVFKKNSCNFYEFFVDKAVFEIDTINDKYAEVQKARMKNFYSDFLKPFLKREPVFRVLEAGCGLGGVVSLLREDSYEAFGIDLPSNSRYWAQLGNSPDNFFCCDANHLPFPDDYFDTTLSFGVFEHIGTVNGLGILHDDYWDIRKNYASELLRVTKPGGRILISCPNKNFPFDIQHGVRDEYCLRGMEDEHSKMTPIIWLKELIYSKTGLTLHKIYGKHYLLSYFDVSKLFNSVGNIKEFTPYSLKNFFGFTNIRNKFISKLISVYLYNIPKFIRSSFLNPYMLVQIKKDI